MGVIEADASPKAAAASAATWPTVAVGPLAGAAAVASCGVTPGTVLALAATVAAVGAIAVGVRRTGAATGRAWLLLALGRCGLLVASVEAASESTIGTLGAATVGYAATGIGLLLLAAHLTRVWDRQRWIDSAAVAGATATAAIGTSLVLGHGDYADRVLLPALPAVALLLVLFATRSLLAVRPRGRALVLLTASLLVQLVGEVALHWASPTGAVRSALALGVATLAAAVLAGAGLAPDLARAPQRTLPWRRLGRVRFAVLASSVATPLVALAALEATGHAEPAATLVLAGGALALALLGLVRVAGLVSYADVLADERHRSRFEALADHASDAVAILAADGTITWASPAVRTVIGPDPDDLVGGDLSTLVGGPTARDLATPLAQLADLEPGSTMSIQARLVDVDGGERELEGTATNLLAEAAVEGIVLVLRDVTERVAMQRQLVEQAFVDPLTGLANRALFVDRVGHALARPRHHDDGAVAVLFIDLDDFKSVNDSLGHHRGDDLLAAVGRRIADALGPADTAARLGGDEFAVLLESTDPEAAEEVATRIGELLAVPLLVGDLALAVAASIGIAVAQGPSETAAILLRNADLAMYEAKREGKGRARAFRTEMHDRELRQFTFRSELRSALERGQLHVLYQPIVDMETEAVTGAEALLRWIHPERGPISPLEFIPVAESTREIVPIGRWVLRTACEQLARWHAELGPLTMDVNVSAVQLLDPGYVDDVAATLRETGVSPEHVVLELTESILVHDEETARRVLEDLRGLGVRLAIDDFGTGYSSLAYLQHFPIDIVKIDRAFVNQLGDAGRGRSLARSIIAIAGSLGIATIAEGVETSAQAADLASLACEHGQGFHWSRPIPPEDFARVAARPDVLR
ncbi:MAG TPA: EAL domain-containing protein [Aquihabitans sp.]|nr:EAL domain-containing protein [Aquihabitans sp.]